MGLKKEEEFFGDMVYEAWKRGHNPDLIQREDSQSYQYDDYSPEEAVSHFFRKKETKSEINTQN